ncbi:MAG: Fic family protein [Candidatus Aenigmarchaeota archaeon]|nr:Fic family protein [Candidatus Aenigmarchaeota archaeon]
MWTEDDGMYYEEKIIRGRKYHYLVENVRTGKNKWKKIRMYMGRGKKSKRQIEDMLKKNREKLREKVRNYLKSVDPLFALVTTEEEKEMEKIKRKFENYIKTATDAEKRKYYEWFVTRFTYDTNAIEGSTLTLQETALILFEKTVPGGKSIREIREAENHKEAFDYMVEYEGDVSKEFILEMHRKLMHNILGKYAGVFRDRQVFVRGAELMPPKPAFVEREFKKLMKWYRRNRKKYHPVVVAAYVHTAFEGIHPFLDGNGRIGRLLLNFILKKNGFPMIDIKNRNKEEYYRAIREAHRGNLRPFVSLVIKYLRENEFE